MTRIHRAIGGNAHTRFACSAARTGLKGWLRAIKEDAVNTRRCPCRLHDLGKAHEIVIARCKVAECAGKSAQQAEAHGSAELFTQLKVCRDVVYVLGMNR